MRSSSPATDRRGDASTTSATATSARSRCCSDFSLRVAPGETVALVGASGSGKSTVSLLLPRFYDVQDGADPHRRRRRPRRHPRLAPRARSASCSRTRSCSPTPCAPTSPTGGPTRPTTRSSARRASPGPTSSSPTLPDGYDTVVGERGLTLSGGQRQRISIARAVLTDPRVLVLDDATSSVDTRTEEQIHATLREIMVGRTTVLIAHRRSTLRLADRIVLVADGTRRRERDARGADGASPRTGPCCRVPATTSPTTRRSTTIDESADPDDAVGGTTVEGFVDPVDGVTPALWDRSEAAEDRARVRRAGGAGRGPQRTRRQRRVGRGVGGGLALAPTPELLAAVDALPPADDDPEVDVAAEAAASEGFRLRVVPPPLPASAPDRASR